MLKANFSISRLSVLRSSSASPLFSVKGGFLQSSFSLFSSTFNSVAKHVLYASNPSANVRISASYFQRTLSSAIFIDSASNTNQRYQTTQFSEKQPLSLTRCTFTKCNGENGGAVCAKESQITITNCYFGYNTAKTGGAISSINGSAIAVSRCEFSYNSADYTGAAMLDSMVEGNDAKITFVNLTGNRAKHWTGAMRVDRNGGEISNCIFENNSAQVCGAFFDFSSPPACRKITSCIFKNNVAVYKGGAYCCFHIKSDSKFDRCVFTNNKCDNSAWSVSIESIDITCSFVKCVFSGSVDKEVSQHYNGSTIDVKKDNQFNADTNAAQKNLLQSFISTVKISY